MSKKKKSKQKTRAQPNAVSWLCSSEAYETLCCTGYTSLAHCPEIVTAVNKIADMVSDMTIKLMENTDKGDVRIRDGLARLVDIAPNRNMTRKTFIATIVRTLLLEGDGNAIVIPTTSNGFIDELLNVPPSRVSFRSGNELGEYSVMIDGVPRDPSDVLHFVRNPDPAQPWKGTGCRAVLKDIANNLKQAAATEKGFMESKWKPSIIVKVDAMVEEFANKEGRKKLLEQYIESSSAGEPWMIPAEQFEVEQIRPLSLNDLAISDTVTLDKRTVASVLGVPPFVLGVGDFNKDAWNNFVNSQIMSICRCIEQELTRKLLVSPTRYYKMNARSLYAYNLQELAAMGDDQYIRGIMTGNEVRSLLDLEPREGLDELIILENYIPRGMIGDQKKLNQSGGEDDGQK